MESLRGITLVGKDSFVFRRFEKLIGIISIHVDDFQAARDKQFIKDGMNRIYEKFKISKQEKS